MVTNILMESLEGVAEQIVRDFSSRNGSSSSCFIGLYGNVTWAKKVHVSEAVRKRLGGEVPVYVFGTRVEQIPSEYYVDLGILF